jgi:serine phosphatase RsbU (regulator of sigma subunit)/TPR repeat protein
MLLNSKITLLFLIILLLFTNTSFGQTFSSKEQKQLDSLNAIINNKASHDTSLASAYVALTHILYLSNLDTVIPLCTRAKEIAEKALAKQPFQKQGHNSLVTLALSKSLSGTLNNIGYVYERQGDMQLALDYYLKSLKISEQIGYKNGIANSFNNIGNIYENQGDITLALEYYQKCLKIKQQIGNKRSITNTLINIGMVYNEQGNIQLALEYFLKSLKIVKETGDKKGIANSFRNIGMIYEKQGNSTLALDYYLKSLKIREQIGDKKGVAISCANLGDLYLKQGDVEQAKQMGVKGLKLSRELGVPENIKSSASLLTKVYTKQGNYKLALEMRNLEIQMRDSIFSEKNMKATVQQKAKFEYDKQQAIKDAEHEKEIALEHKEKEKQQLLTYVSIGGLLLVLAFLAFVFNRLQVTRKQKNIIEQKEQETQHQKEIIEEKHKEITDSINYAERIQRSFLATKELLDDNLKEYFVFFKPKDVVSGDFYWAGKLNNGNFALCCADSTGHGVPGAIMSILNISSIEKSIEKENEPHHILYKTRETIIKRLQKDGSAEGGKDGMDCTLLVLNTEKTQLTYAAANNPVFIVRKNERGEAELIEQKPDKMPVGKHDKDEEPFTLHTYNLQKGDVIYTLTDGMPDQFGGDKGKKYMIKNLKQFFLNIANLPMEEQHMRIAQEFNNWKGELEQVDDVCVVGVRV